VIRFRYDMSGRWWKGNVHVHSTASDGGKSFAELADMYAGAGYDFLYRTDHWAASDVAGDSQEYPLLWLDGIELDGQDERGQWFHVVCLGRVEGIEREMGLARAMDACGQQGALRILAHPHWCGGNLDDALRHGFDGVEVYNHVCRWLNGKSEGGVYWTAMLEANADTLAFAVDDAHVLPEHPGWNGGWIVVNAPERTAGAIDAAIRAGNFYSSCGPAFEGIRLAGKRVWIETSPVAFARLVGPAFLGKRVGSFGGQTLTEAAFELPDDWRWAYLEIEDTSGRRAWTNTLFTADAG